MSKTKSSSKSAKPEKTDILTKVKDAAITKPAQAIKAKSKELAKQVAGKEEKKDKKDKKSKKAAKEPTPEPSESEESASSESSESESEEETSKPATNGKANGAKKPAAKQDASDESGSSDDDEDSASDSESEAEAPKSKSLSKNAKATKPTTKPSAVESDSDESMSDAEASSESASSDEDSDADGDSSEDEKPAKAAAKKAESKVVAPAASESEADDSDSSEESDEEEEAQAKPSKRKAEEDAEQIAKKSKTEAVDTSRGANLFVGNLSWNVDEAWLKEVFEEFGELAGVRIMTDRDSGRSKGFGYVEFTNPEDAAKAHAAKAGAELDGRNLNVDFANARPDNSQKQENRRKSYGDQVSQPSDTLFLGNLSFDVGQETVTEAFAPHGTIMSVRLPTDRETGQPKGFGYVTFASIEEAQAALEAMQGSYIENRPVRLDFSSPRPQNSDSPARGRGGFGGGFGGRGGPRGGARGGRGGRGGSFGGRGGRGGRGGSTNRGGFGDFSGRKTSFD